MIVICINDKGTRPGNFIIGKKYMVSEDSYIPFTQRTIMGEGVEYYWSVVSDLFVPIEKWRSEQIDKILK